MLPQQLIDPQLLSKLEQNTRSIESVIHLGSLLNPNQNSETIRQRTPSN